MLHLPTERLAALSDEPPSEEEAAHLAACDVCARERRAYDGLLAMAAAERDSFGLPLTRWDSIAAAMSTEVAAAPVDIPATKHRAGAPGRWVLQIAAGLLLVAGGAMYGRMSVGGSALPASPIETASVASGNPDSVYFHSVDEARSAQQQAELQYQAATQFLAQNDSTVSGGSSPVAYRSRLAALDRMLNEQREALRSAPHDPVMNGYYLTTLGQREATIRQLNTALPASLRVNSF